MTTTATINSLCCRCFEEGEVFDASCNEKPEDLAGLPLGMYHCPDCGAMVLAGQPHPPMCKLCNDRQHPALDQCKLYNAGQLE